MAPAQESRKQCTPAMKAFLYSLCRDHRASLFINTLHAVPTSNSIIPYILRHTVI